MIKYGGSLSNEYLLVHRGPGLGVSDGLVHDPRVLRHLGGGEDERGVGGGVLRLELLHGLEVARVGDHGGHGLELLERRHAVVVDVPAKTLKSAISLPRICWIGQTESTYE